ncbi:MAG: hypothetical protein RL463_749 [Bacteroidota bacterium]|jgi:hypothetical protein
MLNTKNYFDKVQQLNWEELPEALAKGHKLVEGAAQNNWAAYNTNENIKRVVEAYFQKLSDYLSKNPMPTGGAKPSAPSKSLPKATAPLRTPKSEPPKAPAPKKPEPEDEADYESTPVEYIDTDVQFIRRYAAMHGKVKSQAQILNLLHSLQKAILERRIRKDSIYAKEIELMQTQLIKCYEQMDEMIEVKIDSKNLKRYLEIANSQEGMLSITLLKAYVSLNGKKDVRDRAERLLTRMRKAVTSGKVTKADKYADRLNEAFVTIKTYLDSKSAYLNINKAQLNGLMGILGDDLFGQKKSLNGSEDEEGALIVSSGELLKMDFQTIGLKGKYLELIGDPSIGFTAMVYGLPKSGKSTMCLDFANHLASNHGKVLYCAVEEGFGYTLKEKIERLGAQHANLYITDRVPENLSDYQFVFIDSVSKAGMDVEDIDRLRKLHPETSFIFIYHTTKEGKFKGVNSHAHEVDVIIQVDKGQATSTGRFNAGGKMKI